jgi:hypothetical protein
MVEAFPFGGLFVHLTFKNLSHLGQLEITFQERPIPLLQILIPFFGELKT